MLYIIIITIFVLGYAAIVFEHPLKINKTASALVTGILTWAVFVLGSPTEDFFTHHKFIEAVVDNAHNIGRIQPVEALEERKAIVGEEEEYERELKEHEAHEFYQTFIAFANENPNLPEKDLYAAFGELPETKAYINKEKHEHYIHYVVHELGHHLVEIAQILFFLMGAMTIVELVDAHQGFRVITDRINQTRLVSLMWVICSISFFMSATLDNLTTAIVMASLLTKLIKNNEQKMIFGGMVVIAANAGGAWSPIGDVTTTMLWIGGQVTVTALIQNLIIPSLVCMVIPLIIFTFLYKGAKVQRPNIDDLNATAAHSHGGLPSFSHEGNAYTADGQNIPGSNLMFYVGVAGLVFVPVFKTITHLPPFMGMMISLGVVWITSEIIHSNADDADKAPLSATYALSKIDTSSILFFLGILLAIGSLQSLHLLSDLARIADESIGNQDVIIMAIGLGSAIIDNVPLVAAAMGMYDLSVYPPDHKLWEFLAYSAGTGGSCLIIGSAAGVAMMGLMNIEFGWYLKKIGWLALIGFFAGAFTYLGQHALLHGGM